MKEPLTITTERVDDMPLLLGHMRQMGLAEQLDQHFPRHGNWQGLSLGQVIEVWLAHVLSQADHRMNQVQPWVEHRQQGLQQCTQAAVQASDVSDDRLAAILRSMSHVARWQSFEQELSRQLLRVYDLQSRCVRLDSTSVSSYGTVTEDGLLQLDHSKDHRPDLPQLKIMLATLDPLGMPLATEIVSGERADDPLYLPIITRVQHTLGRHGLLYVGDSKMGALQTRASLHAAGDYYLCPLSAVSMPADQLAQAVKTAQARAQPLQEVERWQADGTVEQIAHGYEQQVEVSAEVDGKTITWTERQLLVCSLAYRQSAQSRFQVRLQRAQQALAELGVARRGKARLTERPQVEQAVNEILARFGVKELLTVQIQETVTEQSVRAYGNRQATVRTSRQFCVSSVLVTEQVEQALALLGWRVYVTNQPEAQLSLPQAVLAYRDEYRVERAFGRLKGAPLTLAPMYVQRDDHATGLVRLLSVALRVLTLLEGVVRRELDKIESCLSGLYAGQPKRVTAHPTAELLLQAFDELTLTVVVLNPSQTVRHLTALSSLQLRIVALLGLSAQIYTQLETDSS